MNGMNGQNGQNTQNGAPDGAAISIQQLKVFGLAVLAIGSIIVLVAEYGQLNLMAEDQGIF